MTTSSCSLIGESRYGTILRLDNDQFCNVIRWVGNGLRKTAVRSLTIEPNLANNLTPDSTSGGVDWLENCGIKTRTTGTTRNREITIEDIHVARSDGLGVYLFGDDVHLRNSSLEAAVHDAAELCDGRGGTITGCTVSIDNGASGYYSLGTDAFDDFQICDNLTIVRAGGAITAAVHRLWPGNFRGAVNGNVIRCEPGGRIGAIFHAYSLLTTITGNSIQGHVDPGGWGTTKIDLNTSVLFTGNVASDCEFRTSVNSLGTVIPTIANGVTRVTQNILESCVPPPSNSQLVFTDNSEFFF